MSLAAGAVARGRRGGRAATAWPTRGGADVVGAAA